MTIENHSVHLIYCDGACSGNPGPGGWAFIHYFPDEKVMERSGFESATTNNRMEMRAAIESLREVPPAEKTLLYTDSSYLIRGITQWIYGWQKRNWKNGEGAEVLNKDLWETLWKITRSKEIEWRYIPGHKGFVGNERVDQLAVAQSIGSPMRGYSGPYSTYPVELWPLPELFPLPEMKNNKKSSVKDKKSVYYLSYVNGNLERHEHWEQCQSRVKGVSQARFKKISSSDEEALILKTWGLSPDLKILKR